jgi:hypothetical protein
MRFFIAKNMIDAHSCIKFNNLNKMLFAMFLHLLHNNYLKTIAHFSITQWKLPS